MQIYGQSERHSDLPTPRLVLDDGQPKFGAWVVLRDPLGVDTLAAEGFDWICIDAQHGGPEIHELQALVEAAHIFSTPTMVRVPGHDVATTTRALDAGAGGIIYPTVEDASTAATLVTACRFPPRGKRSYSPTRRSPRYPKPTPGDVAHDALAILMIETAEGLENLDSILATGPDAIFVGSYDLALALGISLDELTGEGSDGILADIARRCVAAGVTPGLYTGSVALSQAMVNLGFRFMPVALDSGLLAVAARDAAAEVNGLR